MYFAARVIALIPVVTAALSSSAKIVLGADTFETRRDQYLAAVRSEPVKRFTRSERGEVSFPVPDPGKHLWNHLLPLLAEDPSGERPLPGGSGLAARDLVRALVRFPNMFHFNADGPAACLMRHPGLIAPADRSFLFEGHDRSVLAHENEGNYNLFTGEGTENHVMMSRFAGYLYCQDWLADHPDDERAARGLSQCRQYVLEHARDVVHHGPGEFNSSTYYGYQLRGALLCHEFAKDPAVRDACRALLDTFAAEMCLKYVAGVNAAPESRGAARSALAAELDQIVYLWFGGSPAAAPTVASNAVYAALAAYRPPEALARIARKGVPGGTYLNSHPSYLLDRPAHSRESLTLGDGYALSCLYLPVAGYTGATVQFCPAKIVSRGAGGALPWVALGNSNTHSEDGTGRGPWDQWAQHGNVLVQLTYVPGDAEALTESARAVTERWLADWRASFERRWPRGSRAERHVSWKPPRREDVRSYLTFPVGSGHDIEMSDEVAASGVFFLRHGDTFLAVRALEAGYPRLDTPADAGTTRGRHSGNAQLECAAPPGRLAGLVVEVGIRRDHADFAAFRAAVGERTELVEDGLTVRYQSLRGEWLDVRYATEATAPLTEPAFDWGYISDPARDKPMPVMRMPPFEQPTYPPRGQSVRGWGRIPVVTVNGQPLGGERFLDTAAPWPVIRGPHVNQGGGVLTIDDARQWYRLDWTGDAPQWSAGEHAGEPDRATTTSAVPSP